MYIKVVYFSGEYDFWAYNIYSNKNRIVCESAGLWHTKAGAVRAAIKLAIDLDIDYRETKL